MVLSVLRSPSPLRRGALHRLVFFSLMIFQSPMTHSAGGSPISPLQVVAKFFKQQQQQAKSPDQVPVYLTAVCRAMLFPGNLVRSVDWSAVVSFDSLAAFANDLNATGVWEEAFELATKQTGWWKSIKSPEILLAGSWSLLFGAVVTIISGRMHFLALMGAGMLGYAMHLNALTPTMQFLLCVAIVIHGVAQRPRDYDTKEPAKPAVSAPGPKAVAKAQAESRKKK